MRNRGTLHQTMSAAIATRTSSVLMEKVFISSNRVTGPSAGPGRLFVPFKTATFCDLGSSSVQERYVNSTLSCAPPKPKPEKGSKHNRSDSQQDQASRYTVDDGQYRTGFIGKEIPQAHTGYSCHDAEAANHPTPSRPSPTCFSKREQSLVERPVVIVINSSRHIAGRLVGIFIHGRTTTGNRPTGTTNKVEWVQPPIAHLQYQQSLYTLLTHIRILRTFQRCNRLPTGHHHLQNTPQQGK